MRAYKLALVFLVALVLASISLSILAQTYTDVYTDSDAYLRHRYSPPPERDEDFRFISNSDTHPVRVFYVGIINPLWRVWRSYMHFPVDKFPTCFNKIDLVLDFNFIFRPREVVVYALDWDGVSRFGLHTEPTSYWHTRVPVRSSGTVQVDVTEAVKIALDEGRNVAFGVRIANEIPPGRIAFYIADFVDPYLRFELCKLNVDVTGLSDATVTQPVLAASRYVSMGDLTVAVTADIPYEVRACYDVDPEPSPAFTADPFDLAYTWAWFTLPRCPAYTVLSQFSGNPGEEKRTYRARVDLADLGDRASGEVFTFTVRVWAVPR